jgi:hypothetical protein
VKRLYLFLKVFILSAVPVFGFESVSIVSPVKVYFGTAPISLSDGLWTPYSPNVAYMLGRVGIGTSAPSQSLDVLGPINISSGTNFFEIGTKDAYGNPQIWNKGSGAVLRLGASQADGDSTDASAKGLLIYDHTNDYFSYFKADRIGLYRELAATPYLLANATSFAYISQWGTTGSIFSVSTGTTKLFNVLGTSVAFKVPIVLPDGTMFASTTSFGSPAVVTIDASNNVYTSNAGAGGYSGTGNIGIGYQALNTSLSGNTNVAVGYQALKTLSGGYYNVALGQAALGQATDSNYSIGIGYAALYNYSGSGSGASGQHNIAIGREAGYQIQTADDNILIGYRAGYGNTGANYNNNIAVGHEAGYSISAGSAHNIFLGYQAGYSETGSGKLYISSSAVNPLIFGDFQAKTLQINGTVKVGVSTGTFTIMGSTAANTNCGVVGSYCGELRMNDGSIHYFSIY